MNEIPADLIFNWDQTALSLITTSQWTLHQAGEIITVKNSDKCQVTAVLAASLTVNFYLPKSSTRARLNDLIRKWLYPQAGMFGIVITTGQMKRP